MNFDMKTILNDVVLTLTRPVDVAQKLLRLNLPVKTSWLIFALGITLSLLVSTLQEIFIPLDALLGALFEYSPKLSGEQVETSLLETILVIISTVMWIFVTYFIALKMGGKGNFPQHLAVFAWLQFFDTCLSALILVLASFLIVAPSLMVLYFPGLAILLFMAVRSKLYFLKECHKFDSLLRSFGVFFAAFIVLAIVGSIMS